MILDFNIGDIISNKKLTSVFCVANMGGMRRSKTTGTLVLISDHTKMYNDKWYGNELHYTGMGKNDDQTIKKTQNKTLAESNHNGIEIHLFEVFRAGEYTYQGIVKLAGEPYQEYQQGDDGQPRKVWMFPLRRLGN